MRRKMRRMAATVRILLVLLACGVGACRSDKPAPGEARKPPPPPPSVPVDPLVGVRQQMVDETIAARGIRDLAVLDAMRTVPRHEMVPPEVRDEAYADRALPIGFGLTISQPYIVGVMTEAAEVEKGNRVLEIGTGSGYQAAVLAELGAEVYTIEIHEELAARTRKVLARIGYDQVHLKTGDGYEGWPSVAPFDAIIVTAAAPLIPPPLLDQLRPGGRMVIPIGDDYAQNLVVVVKRADGTFDQRELFGVRFGPMLGKVAEPR
jgi:protein-L-isoaspartate(D-aspartate) O-methyltransferase